LGAAYLAGLKAGVYTNIDYLKTLNKDKRVLQPKENDNVHNGYEGWEAAVESGAEANRKQRVDSNIIP
jgi:glycerol kinase